MSDNKDSIETRLSELVNAYDLDGLVALSQQAPESDADTWRHEIMESGFMALYSYLSYDQACGKLGDWGLDMLSNVVTAAENFHGSPLREMRAEVLSFRSDETKDTHPEQAKDFLLKAIHELSQEIPVPTSVLKFRAGLYDELARLDTTEALHNWQAAVEDLKASASANLWILYHAWEQPIPGMPEIQKIARDEFQQWLNIEMALYPDRIWKILDDGTRMLENQTLPDLEELVSSWLQDALAWRGNDAKPELLRQAGMILHKQGKKWQRADYFAKAVECFDLFIMKEPAHAMEVHYQAAVWEDWALLNEQKGESGVVYMMEAWNAYRIHEEVVSLNFSPLLHYVEFLERLYHHKEMVERPTAEEIIALAVEAEDSGRGYYSGPGMIQARMAIDRDDSETAIYHLSRLLLLFELCIDREIKNLRESLTDNVSSAVVEFLDEALSFMDEVSQGYFYNPSLTLSDLNKLSQSETLDIWEKRMIEIRNRRPLN